MLSNHYAQFLSYIDDFIIMFICAFQVQNEDKKVEVKLYELSSLVGHQDKTTFPIRQGLQDEGSYERRPRILN